MSICRTRSPWLRRQQSTRRAGAPERENGRGPPDTCGVSRREYEGGLEEQCQARCLPHPWGDASAAPQYRRRHGATFTAAPVKQCLPIGLP